MYFLDGVVSICTIKTKGSRYWQSLNSCLVILFVFITSPLCSHALFNILGIKIFSYSAFYFLFIIKPNGKKRHLKCVFIHFKQKLNRSEESQLFQSWNLKQSLAIFQTGWSLLGEAWAVKRKFWLKKRGLFPSNLTVPPVTTSSVVWPWVACSWTGWQSSVWTWNSLDGRASKNSPRASCPDTAFPFHTKVALSR